MNLGVQHITISEEVDTMIRLIEEAEKFRRSFEKLNKAYQLRAEKLIKKLIENPEIGKPMMYTRKGTREVYMAPFRLSYAYSKDEEKRYLLDIYHKDAVNLKRYFYKWFVSDNE